MLRIVRMRSESYDAGALCALENVVLNELELWRELPHSHECVDELLPAGNIASERLSGNGVVGDFLKVKVLESARTRVSAGIGVNPSHVISGRGRRRVYAFFFGILAEVNECFGGLVRGSTVVRHDVRT